MNASTSRPHLADLCLLVYVRLLAVLLCTLCLLPLQALAASDFEHWQYRWGDSPFVNGIPVWTQQDEPEQWQAIDFPSNPPNRAGQQNVWYRTTVPKADSHDPVIYIFSVDLIVEVYLEGERIYHYGEFDAEGQGLFQGWPWHMIPLPDDAAGKPIHFRIFSNYLDIGLWGEVKVMDRLALYHQILHGSLTSLLISAFSLVIALLCLLFALLNTERRSLLALALFCFAHAGLALSGSQAKQLLMHAPLLWDYVEASSYFMLPIALILLLRTWFGSLYHRLFNLLLILFLGYFVAALGLSLSSVTTVAHTYPPFDLLFALLVPALLVIVARRWSSLHPDQRILLLATALLSGLLLVDMAVAHDLLPWGQVPVDYGSLVFSLTIVTLTLNQFARTRKALTQLTRTLESRVAERTRELEQLADKEAARVKALEFGNDKRSLLDALVLNMETQPGVDEAITCLTEHIGELCSPLPGALYRRRGDDGPLLPDRHWNTQTELPAELHRDHLWLPNSQWTPFIIEYDAPYAERRTVACLLLDFTMESPQLDRMSPYTLKTLFTRGIERLNLTLSKIALQQALSRFSFEDGLTGLHNRRYLDEMLNREFTRARRTGASLALIICDIDHFKRLNDTHGHAAGDAVLKVVAKQLRDTFRSSDIICRYGGEEFVIVMPESGLEDARSRAEQLRLAMAAQEIHFNAKPLGLITLSAGVSAGKADDSTPALLLEQADAALYRAKNSGRNRVVTMAEAEPQCDAPMP